MQYLYAMRQIYKLRVLHLRFAKSGNLSFNVLNLNINFSSFTHYHRRFSRRQLRYVYIYVCNIVVCVMGHEESICLCFCSTRVESSMRCALMSTTYLHIKDREIDIEITEKTIDKKEFFLFLLRKAT